jgi:hypothetical protein
MRNATLGIVVAAAVLQLGAATPASARTLPIKTESIASINSVVRQQESAVASVVQKAQQAEQLGTLRYRIATLRQQTWSCQQGLGETPSRAGQQNVARLPQSVAYLKWAAKLWSDRASACGAKKAERVRQWNWRAFPSWIISLGVCESGGSGGAAPGEPNWYAEGSSSDGTFFSAFNISRSVYDRDAHHMGVRGWYGGKGVPSPYEQAMAVIGHVRLYGDGFTGSCAGIARSSWN